MKANTAFAVSLLVLVGTVSAQMDTKNNSGTMVVRGCLQKSRQNYLVVSQRGMSYALKGVGDKLDADVGREVEVSGELTGDIKMGVRQEEQGSNPSDTVRAAGGRAPSIQVSNVATDVRKVAEKCTSQ